MTNDSHSDIIAALDRRIGDVTTLLEAARQAVPNIASLEAELDRLQAARKALAAPQSPAGRRRIGDGQRRRKAGSSVETIAEAARPASSPMRKCDQCHEPIDGERPGLSCGHKDCDGGLHAGDCFSKHVARFHQEAE